MESLLPGEDRRFIIESDDEEDAAGAADDGSYSDSSSTNQWPQSYRQSIDNQLVQSPSLSFLGTPTPSRPSNYFLENTFQGQTREINSNLVKPLILPTTSDEHQQYHQHEDIRKSSEYLLPSRKLSLQQIPQDQTPPVIDHEVSPQQECSYTQGAMNGINLLCGVGILSTPYAMKQGGWLGLVILAVFAVLAWYTGVLLRRSLDSTEGLQTYPDIGQAAFGSTGRIAISIILYVELYACGIEYLILESDNLSKLFPNVHISIGSLTLNSHVFFSILTTLIVMPTTWLRDLTCLSYISAGGVIASILLVICLFWIGVVDNVGFENKGSMLNLPGIPIAIGLYGYCYSGHGVFPNIYSSLKNCNQFPSILFTCIGFSTVLFAASAVMGYKMFGESTESQFTLNLPQDLVVSKIAIWTTVANPITKYALDITPLAMGLEELLPRSQQKYSNKIILRSALVISTLIVALSVPFFALVMALLGSLLAMLVTYILPCACFLAILKTKVPLHEVAVCSFIIIVGVICACVGTYSSISEIVQNYT
ncbi:unnamed protein product [Alopecurus aequalis]